MAFVVLYDACVLYPASLRDLLIRVARTGVVQAQWSERILDEVFLNLVRKRPDLDPNRLARSRGEMERALPDASVTGWESLAGGIVLPDPADGHVVAAAIAGNAQVVVTFNLVHFPADVLEPLGIEAKHPDDFLLDVLDLAPAAVAQALAEQASDLIDPPRTIQDVLRSLEKLGLIQSVARFRELMHP